MTDSVNPNPFDHGHATLRYRSVPEQQQRQLQSILNAGWSIGDVHRIRAFDRNTPYSNVYRVDTEQESLVLRVCKTLHAQQQQVVDGSKHYAADGGIPVPLPRDSMSGDSWYESGGQLYSVCRFVKGTHFTGADTQLLAAARLLAEFHRHFVSYENRDQVETVNGDVYPRDESRWTRLRQAAEHTAGSFDRQVLAWMDEVDCAGSAMATDFSSLPIQVVHCDWHPHNLIFSAGGEQILAVLDFDLMRVTQRARDVALAMHKFGRVFGTQTEFGLHARSTTEQRCRLFLAAYQQVHPLSTEETLLLPDLLFDEARRKLIYILGKHYELQDDSSDFDLEKHIVQIRELAGIRRAVRGDRTDEIRVTSPGAPL